MEPIQQVLKITFSHLLVWVLGVNLLLHIKVYHLLTHRKTNISYALILQAIIVLISPLVCTVKATKHKCQMMLSVPLCDF